MKITYYAVPNKNNATNIARIVVDEVRNRKDFESLTRDGRWVYNAGIADRWAMDELEECSEAEARIIAGERFVL